jgi:8-oxo-dGTP pyrophosphatase MutT (NUDIX family)
MTITPNQPNHKNLDEVYAYLAAAKPVDQREVDSMQTFTDELARLHDPCSETADSVHVTASAIVIGTRGVILHRHKRLGIWIQPGGHIDPHEHPADAAIREVREETGLETAHFCSQPTIIHVDAHPAPKGHTHLDLRYLLIGNDVDPSPPDGESPDVSWLSVTKALTIADDGLRGVLGRLREEHERYLNTHYGHQ